MIGRENTVAGVDLTTIRVDQARLLRQNALQSCLIVEGVIVFYALVIGFVASWQYAALWTLGASIMVLVSFIHSRIAVKGEITEANHRQYLFSHILVCATTGAVWAGFAIGLIDFDSSMTIVFACFLATAITLGGILPSSEYRPGFIALATTDHLPLAVYILLAGSGPFRLLGLGMLMFYAFCMYASARSELDTRDSIAARNMTSLNQQLLQKNADIERAAEEKSRFLAATSHDLSQPLHAQGLLIQALKSRLTTSDQIDLLERIERSWQNQNSILRGLVDVTKLDNGVIIPRLQPVDLVVELQAIVEEFRETANEKGVSLTAILPTCSAYTDPALLSRIVRNLLSNAVKFTPADGNIELSLKPEDDHVQINLRDNGQGIPEEWLERVFEEYVQIGNPNRDRSLGLGLGLAIVKRLVSLMDLPFEFSSKLNEGTSCRLSVPKAIRAAQPKPNDQAVHHIPNSPLILVVDDEPDIRESTSVLLTDWGCRVVSASTLEESISLLNAVNAAPSALLVDQRLAEDVRGTDLIPALREELNDDVPAILVTADIDGIVLSDTEGTRILTKPLAPPDLFEALSSLIADQTSPSN